MKLDDSTISKNISIATEFFKVYQAVKVEKLKKKLINYSGGTTGFIPFTIDFTLDGISGIKIYDKLIVDSSFLPVNYSNTLEFIVTGIDHSIKDGDWETNIKVTLIPKFEEITESITAIDSNIVTYSIPPSSVSSTSTINSTPSQNKTDNNSNWATKVKDAAEVIFPNLAGGEAAACAKYVTMISRAIIDAANGNQFKSTYLGGWGNACDFGYKNNILNSGIYELIYEKNDLTKNDIIKKIDNDIQPTAEYGDILQYFLTNKDANGNIIASTLNSSRDASNEYVLHVQIFTGNWATSPKKDGRNLSSIGWTSSYPSNYASNFVYRSRPLKPNMNIFTLYWFRVKNEYRK